MHEMPVHAADEYAAKAKQKLSFGARSENHMFCSIYATSIIHINSLIWICSLTTR